jgi:2-methylcitrate dehydratase
MKEKRSDNTKPQAPGLGRRDLMKMGAVAGVAAMTQMLHAPRASAQEAATGLTQDQRSAYRPEAWREAERYAGVKMETGPGWKNDSNRASGNGPMDDTSRQIVEYVSAFSESNLTDPLVSAFHNTMVDSIASLISGFESEPARICARLARTTQSDLKSTVLGYGITTSPELAAYANSSMLRYTDFNDHISDMMGGVLAIGEALHSTGTQVMMAIILAYQIDAALNDAGGNIDGLDFGLYYAPAVAVAMGKLLGLNEDQLANALSVALSLHIPVRVDRSGTLSMQKGCSTAEAVRVATFCALAAREGMTGPAQPFEGRDGLWDRITGPYKEKLRLPPSGQPGIALTTGIKRRPAEGYTQALHETIIPQVRAWTKAADIASIHVEMNFSGWLEIADPPKWDPRNRETADHSMAYEVARALIDGDVYVDSFTHEKIMDPVARGLMEKITVSVNPDYVYQGQVRMTVRTKAGGKLIKETSNPRGENNFGSPVTHEEIIAKFNRICAFMHVSDEQKDRALAQWSNLRAVKDIAEPMQNLAKFGRPLPL